MRGLITVLLCLLGLGGAVGYYTIHSLHHVIDQLAEEQQKLEQNLKTLSASVLKEEGSLQDMEQTLQFINQQLKFGGDAKAALEMLEGVDHQLLQPIFDAYPALRTAVHSDLEKLQGNPIVDKAAVWFRLQQLTGQLQPEPQEEVEGWKGALQGLVSVHKRDVAHASRNDLFPLLYIEQAMWAVLYDQPKIYEQSLAEAEKMLEPILSAPNNQTLKKELNDLKSVRLSSEVVTVDRSIQALIELLKGEPPHV